MIGGDLGTFGLSDLAGMIDILQEATKQHTKAVNELSFCNRRQEDILHMIELSDITKRELNKLAKELQDVRRRRRIAKNTIAILTPILDWKDKNSAAYLKLTAAIGKFRKMDEELKAAKYHMKATEDEEIINHFDMDDVQ